MALIQYTWNLPKNISRDAKYAIRPQQGERWRSACCSEPTSVSSGR